MKHEKSIAVDTLRVMYEHNYNLTQHLIGNKQFKDYKTHLIDIKRTPHKELDKHYYNVFEVSIDRLNICYLAFDFKENKLIDYIQVNFHKHFLYRIDFTDYINILQTQLTLHLHHITRIDIAYDTTENIIQKIFNKNNHKNYFLTSLKKEVKQLKGAYTFNNKTFNNSIYFQTSNKSKTLCVYDKTSEIKDNKLKQQCVIDYLSRRFTNNQNIYRVEVRLTHSELTKYTKSRFCNQETIVKTISIDILKLDDPDILTSVFNHFFDTLLQIRKKDKHYGKRNSKCEKIDILDNKSIMKIMYDFSNQERKQIQNNQINETYNETIETLYNLPDLIRFCIQNPDNHNVSKSELLKLEKLTIKLKNDLIQNGISIKKSN